MEPSTASGALLGFDTATDDSTVAVAREGEVLGESRVDAVPGERPRHAAALLAQLAATAEGVGGWAAIAVIAVGVGPGTFTGLRIGVTTARALAQGLGLPLAPVGSLAALAGGIGEHPRAVDRPRLAAIDARRGEAFAALYAPDGEAVWEPFVAPPEAIASRLADLAGSESGDSPGPPLAAGSGSLRFRSQLEAAGTEVLADEEPAHRIWARHVCRLAEAVTTVGPELVEPIYLRRPDAELWREQQNRDGGKRS